MQKPASSLLTHVVVCRAADWPKDPVWTGKVKITAKGQKATVFLLDANTNATFATCHVEEGSVERG
jgi:hypothetical protein